MYRAARGDGRLVADQFVQSYKSKKFLDLPKLSGKLYPKQQPISGPSHVRFFMRIISSLLLIIAFPVMAQSQDNVLINGPFSLSQILDTVNAAHNSSLRDYEASAPRPNSSPADEKIITVTRKGVPVLAYRPKFYDIDGWQADLTFSCGPQGTVDITQLLESKNGEVIPSEDQILRMHIMAPDQKDHRLPVTLIETLSYRGGLIRVHSRIPADHELWRDLKPTSNLRTQLIANGRYKRFHGVGDLTNFSATVEPLLVACANNIGISNPSRTPAPAPAPASRSTSSETPDANTIKMALEAKVAQQMAAYDGMSDQCKTFKRDDSTIGAIACMMSGFGMASSQNMAVTIHSVSLDECVQSDSGVFYCRYRVNAEMRGSGMMGQVADLANMGMAASGWSYGGFERVGGTWSLIRTYEHCSWSGETINCTYTN